jgi:hypothetical protein
VQIPNRPSFLHTRKFAREAIFPVQAAYWHKQLGELRMQAEEVRVLLEKVTESVAEPIKAQVTLDRMPWRKETLR